jgi:transposase
MCITVTGYHTLESSFMEPLCPSAWADLDWSMSAHQVCLLKPGHKPVQRSFPHSAAGLAQLTGWLSAEAGCEPLALLVALEVPHGPVVAALLSAGFSTFSINPKQLDRFRDRRSLAGAKDDRLDALTLADSLRTDFAAFSALSIPDDLTVALRAATRRRETLLADVRRFANRLLQSLWASYPDLLALCPAANEPWLWRLLGRLSSPTPPRSLRKASLAALLSAHRKRNVSADALAVALAAPTAASGASLRAILDDIASLLPQLTAAASALTITDARIAELVHQAGETARILDSMPGIDCTLAAVFLAEAPLALAAADLNALRSLSGAAPVTLQSGRSRTVRLRRACNPRLRNAVRHWARTAARCAPWARCHYTAMRSRGLDHERALRGIADRLLLRLVACLRSRALYDPLLAARHLTAS